jgi:hypothetical protein
MVDVKKATEQIAKLTLMKFFPQEKQARAALVEMVCSMAGDNERIEWLVRRALVLFNEWPGPKELRALLCSRWKPADGVEAYSSVYISDENGGGFPTEKPAPPPMLTPGRDEARKLLRTVFADDTPKTGAKTAPVPQPRRSLPAPPPIADTQPEAKRITPADIDRAVQEYRSGRAKQDLNAIVGGSDPSPVCGTTRMSA